VTSIAIAAGGAWECSDAASDFITVPLGKPGPAVYRHALERLGAMAEECLIVEDRTTGVRAASASGVKPLRYVGSMPTYGDGSDIETVMAGAG
jgi:beta-phosphoglucomutase-like phosphatase (HAD superfamily)